MCRTVPGGEAAAPAVPSKADVSVLASKPVAAAFKLKPSVPSGGSASDSDSSRQACMHTVKADIH